MWLHNAIVVCSILGASPVPWAPYSRRGGVAGPLGPVWPPWGRGWSPGPRVAVVGAYESPVSAVLSHSQIL